MAIGITKTFVSDRTEVITNFDGCTDSFYTTEATCEARGDCLSDDGQPLTRYTETDCNNFPGDWTAYIWYDDIQTISGNWSFDDYKDPKQPYISFISITKVEVGIDANNLVEQAITTNYIEPEAGKLQWVEVHNTLGGAVATGTYLFRITYEANVSQHRYFRRTKKWTNITSTETGISNTVTETGVTFSSGDATTSSFTAPSGFVSDSYILEALTVDNVVQDSVYSLTAMADSGVVTITDALDAAGEVVSNANYTVISTYAHSKDIVRGVSNSGQTVAGDWEFVDWRYPNQGDLQFYESITRVQVGTNSSNLVDQTETTNYTVDSEGEITWVEVYDDQDKAVSNGNYYFRITYTADGVISGYSKLNYEPEDTDESTWEEISFVDFKKGEMSDGFDPFLQSYNKKLVQKEFSLELSSGAPSGKPGTKLVINETVIKALIELKNEVDDLGGTITFDDAWETLENTITKIEKTRTTAVNKMEEPYGGGGSTA
tara:strand:+ start:853 stop:2319 length:1467 start_codon:yes stop_codon:yes gene_type:complete